jgi:hypothetical protein
MTDIFIYKINIKKSEIPKTLKLPKHVYHLYPANKKPNSFLNTKIDLKKTEFIFEVIKGDEYYYFKRLDPFPLIWSFTNAFYLNRNKEYPKLFQGDEQSPLFISSQTTNVTKLTYDEVDKSFTNHTSFYAGKTRDKQKYYDETFVHFDFIKEKKIDDIFEVIPSGIKKKLNKENLKKSFKILSKKATASKEFFSRRAFSYQNVFSSYDKYNLDIVVKKLHELKFYVLPGQDSYSDKKHFFMFLEQYIFLIKKVLKTDDTVKVIREVNSYLSYDKDKKKYSENLILYMDLISEYIESNRKKN